MIIHYLKIFGRNLRKSPSFILINIMGLSVGMAASILIFLFVQHELSYDTYHEDSDRIFRVSRAWYNHDGEISLHLGHAAPPFAPLFKSDFEGQVEEAVRLLNINLGIKEEHNIFEENRFFFADPEIFRVFSWPLKEGDASTALAFPDGLVLSETMAAKYFGNQDPMGRALTIMAGDNSFEMIVRGIMKDIPDNSHIKADFLASMGPVVGFYGGYEEMMKNFGNNSFGTYLKLAEGVDHKAFEARLPDFLDRHLPINSRSSTASLGTSLFLWPIEDVHLFSNLDSEMEPNSSIEYVYIYSAIAIFILLIACINFMNLATARSAKRAMEVGMRKVLGADRQLLIRQFMGETIFMSVLAMIIALILALMALPFFSNFTGKELSLNLFTHPEYLIGGVLLVITVGLIAGSYPSLFLSGFQPVRVLKGTYKIGSIHEKFRSILVVSQFAISIVLIVAVLVVLNQLDFMKNKDLGFEKDEIVVLPAYSEFTDNYEMLRDRLLKHNGIRELALASRVPSGRLLDSQGTQAEVNGELTSIDIRVADIHVSHSFMQTFGMQVVAGRDFDYFLASDSTQAFVLNESAVRAIGWGSPEAALNKQLNYGGRRGYVIGVVRDFHFESLHQPISPMIFLIPEDRFNEVAVKLNAPYKEEAMAYLKEEWLALKPDFPFNYYSVADRFVQQYHTEARIATVFGFFAGLAIMISALGLFGLSAYATELRVKEIGIRKTMGAGIWNIIVLLGTDFLKLVLLSFALAIPIAWLGMNEWLDNFAYSTRISWITFLVAGFSAVTIAGLTVSAHTMRAAMVNPVETLKSR